MKLKKFFVEEQLDLAWWVEIVTEYPTCTYYFGPFANSEEAQSFLPGYIEDLQQEGHQEIRTQIKYCQPEELTIFEEKQEENSFFACRV
jgi:hypothetical protein